jgi:hypothetical protein
MLLDRAWVGVVGGWRAVTSCPFPCHVVPVPLSAAVMVSAVWEPADRWTWGRVDEPDAHFRGRPV